MIPSNKKHAPVFLNQERMFFSIGSLICECSVCYDRKATHDRTRC